MSAGELWHWEGRVYRLVEPVKELRPLYERKKIDGLMRTVQVGSAEYVHVRAELVGNEELHQLANDTL